MVACTPAILATAALICGTAGALYCETMQFPQEGSDAILFVGTWSYRTRNYVQAGDEIWVIQTCRNYNYLERELNFAYDLDSKARTAMAFSILAPLVGGFGTVVAYLAACGGALSDSRWKAIGNAFMLACVLQGLTLLIQSSSICFDNPVMQLLESQGNSIRDSLSDDCEWGPGYRLIISSVVLWFLAGLSTRVLECPKFDRSEPSQSQAVTYQRNPDGTVQETNVQVVKGAAVEEEQYKE